MMLRERVYKSMDLDDFMDATCNIVAKTGLCVMTYIQDINYERKYSLKDMPEDEIKKKFMERIVRACELAKKLDITIQVESDERFYEIWYEKEE